MKQNPLIILDFGSQYTQLIARRVREMGVYCEIYPHHIDGTILKTKPICGVILSGGPATVIADDALRAPQWLFESNLPLLGICYGMQTMAAQLGGQVVSSTHKEFGYAQLIADNTSRLLHDIHDELSLDGQSVLDVWMSHGDQVTQLPTGFKANCHTHNTPIAGMEHESRPWYGVQFHPEVTHTRQGMQILKRFVVDICKAQTNWVPCQIVEQLVTSIQQQVGQEEVLLGLSGGVDSSVVAALLHQAIGRQLICVFVDTGLLRLHEAEQVMAMFHQHMGIRIIKVDAQAQFLHALAGVVCPEAKRKIIGKTFIDIFEQEACKLSSVAWLAQGTIYPDVIESSHATGASHVIKSHHNVGGLPKTMQLKLLEPIRTLFKDEVRTIGMELGLPHEMVYRHPFPGPGLGVRILGEVKQEYADILRKADAIFIDELHKANWYQKVAQAFAVFLPVKSVGVMGDGRRYDYVICLRAVETSDFMTAHWAQLPWDFLSHVSNRIINEVAGVSRVTYDISGKPPATIEWE